MFSKRKDEVIIGHLIFYVIFIAYILVCMTRTCFNSATAVLVKEGIMTKSQTGFITTMFYLVYTIFQIPGGILADKYKPTKLILLGVIGTLVANTVIYFNNSYPVMLTFWILNGISQMAFWPAILKVIASDIIINNIKNSSFIFSFSTAIGFSFSFLVGALVKRWQDNFLFSAIVMVVVLIVLLSLSKTIDKLTYIEPKVVDKKEENKENILKVLMRSGFILVIPVCFCWTLVKQGGSTLMSTMLVENYPDVITPSIGNVLTSVSTLSGILGIIAVKLLLGKFKKLNQLSVFEIGFIFLLPFWFFMPKIGAVDYRLAALSLYLTQVVCATGQFIINIEYVMVFKKYGREATVSGIVNSICSFAFVAANYGCALISEKFGWGVLNTVLLIMLVIVNACLLVEIPIWTKFIKKN